MAFSKNTENLTTSDLYISLLCYGPGHAANQHTQKFDQLSPVILDVHETLHGRLLSNIFKFTEQIF